jgi:hypothetical protein
VAIDPTSKFFVVIPQKNLIGAQFFSAMLKNLVVNMSN